MDDDNDVMGVDPELTIVDPDVIREAEMARAFEGLKPDEAEDLKKQLGLYLSGAADTYVDPKIYRHLRIGAISSKLHYNFEREPEFDQPPNQWDAKMRVRVAFDALIAFYVGGRVKGLQRKEDGADQSLVNESELLFAPGITGQQVYEYWAISKKRLEGAMLPWLKRVFEKLAKFSDVWSQEMEDALVRAVVEDTGMSNYSTMLNFIEWCYVGDMVRMVEPHFALHRNAEQYIATEDSEPFRIFVETVRRIRVEAGADLAEVSERWNKLFRYHKVPMDTTYMELTEEEREFAPKGLSLIGDAFVSDEGIEEEYLSREELIVSGNNLSALAIRTFTKKNTEIGELIAALHRERAEAAARENFLMEQGAKIETERDVLAQTVQAVSAEASKLQHENVLKSRAIEVLAQTADLKAAEAAAAKQELVAAQQRVLVLAEEVEVAQQTVGFLDFNAQATFNAIAAEKAALQQQLAAAVNNANALRVELQQAREAHQQAEAAYRAELQAESARKAAEDRKRAADAEKARLETEKIRQQMSAQEKAAEQREQELTAVTRAKVEAEEKLQAAERASRDATALAQQNAETAKKLAADLDASAAVGGERDALQKRLDDATKAKSTAEEEATKRARDLEDAKKAAKDATAALLKEIDALKAENAKLKADLLAKVAAPAPLPAPAPASPPPGIVFVSGPVSSAYMEEKRKAIEKARAHWAAHPRAEAIDKARRANKIVKTADKYVPGKNDFPGVDTSKRNK